MKVRTTLLLLSIITIAYSGLTDVYEDFLSKPQYQLYFSAEKWGPKILKVKEEAGSSLIKLPVNKDGLTYACEIEKPVEIKKTVSEEDNKKEILSKALEQLEPMASGSCISFSQEWWSYEFCYKKHIIQYHKAKPTDPPEHNMEFCIGKYPTAEKLEDPDFKYQKEIYKRGPFGKNYLTQMMVDGTICDITGKPRQAELRFYCGESEGIQSVKEVSTCNYVVIINTPRLCSNPGFDSKKSLNSILCHPISDHDEEENLETDEQPKNLPFPVFRRKRSMAEIEKSKEHPKKIYQRKVKKHTGVTYIKKDENDKADETKNSEEQKKSEEKRDAIKKNLEDQLEKKRSEFLDTLLPYANELNLDDKVVDKVLNELADSLADAIDKTTDNKDGKVEVKGDDLSFEVVTKEKLKSWLEKRKDKISNADDVKFEVVLLDKNGKRYEVSNSDTDVENIMDFIKEFGTENTNTEDLTKINEKEKKEKKLVEENIEEIGNEKEDNDNEKSNKKQDKINKHYQ
jgi:hypothetical protein